jgi:hypothetical protein
MTQPAFKLRQQTMPEHSLQRQAADALRIELGPPGKLCPGAVVWYAIDMAGYTGKVPGTRVGRGCCEGVLDFFFLSSGRGYFAEQKRSDGVLSPGQMGMCSALLLAGGMVGVFDEAAVLFRLLDGWGIPRAHRIHGIAA